MPFRIFMKKRKGFIFTDKKHSNRAVMAAILGVISLGSLGAMVFLSYRNGGKVGAGFGAGALLAALYSTVGLILGLLTVQEKERYRLFPILGIILNLAALVSIGLIVYAGGSLE
ncbi:MAG: hypothetical protein HFH93_12325 [Lachnospiraceae bacterium]|nr:hypothetical protein [Lachnospiraceae bacterium]